MPKEVSVMVAIRRGERVAAVEALRLLRVYLGWFGAAAVLLQLTRAKLMGQPFGQLGAARDERDRLSRRQCGDLVLLDRALSTRLPEPRRMELLAAVVMAGAGPFLDAMLPHFPAQQLTQMAPRLAASFFNAEGEVQASDGEGFRFDVRRCRFVELLDAVDASHLGTLFCAADESYFDGVRRPITLHRTRTLARGGASCDFHFRPAAASATPRRDRDGTLVRHPPESG